MRRFIAIVLGAALASAFACSTNAPIGSEPPTAGTGGPTNAAGTGGPAGAVGTGVAGTSGGAGTWGGAGTGFGTGFAGTSGTAGVSGFAGTGGTMAGCSAYGTPTLASGRCAAGAFKRAGICACQSNLPNVCADSCVDVQTDDDNCGCCGHACGPTSACNAGVCGPPPVEIVPASPGCQSIDLAVRNGNLVWTDPGHARVMRMPAYGGAGTILASGVKPSAGIQIAADGTVFWLELNGIRRTAPNGPPFEIASSDRINGFVLTPDAQSVYYSSETTIFRVPAIGGTPEVVASELHGGLPMALALDGDRLVFPTGVNGDVDVVTLGTGQLATCGSYGPNGEDINVNCVRLARSQGSLWLFKIIVARPGLVVWADGSVLKSADTNPIGVPANDLVAYASSGNIAGMAATSSTIYFSENAADFGTTGGAIYKAPIARDQVAIRIARGQDSPGSVAVDEKRVYWSTGDCRIMATGL